jgi:hypothetical protein
MVQGADVKKATSVVLSQIQALRGMAQPITGDDGKPTNLELILPDLPGGISGSLFSGLACRVRAVER